MSLVLAGNKLTVDLHWIKLTLLLLSPGGSLFVRGASRPSDVSTSGFNCRYLHVNPYIKLKLIVIELAIKPYQEF